MSMLKTLEAFRQEKMAAFDARIAEAKACFQRAISTVKKEFGVPDRVKLFHQQDLDYVLQIELTGFVWSCPLSLKLHWKYDGVFVQIHDEPEDIYIEISTSALKLVELIFDKIKASIEAEVTRYNLVPSANVIG